MGRFFLDTQFEAVRRALATLPDARTVLDVGGGHDQVASRLVDAGYDVTVLGSGPDCFRPPDPPGSPYRRLVAPLLELPLADGAVDVALSLRSLPHLDGWTRLIGELCRVARLAVIVDYPTGRSLNALAPALFPIKRRIERDTRTYTVFPPGRIARAFGQSGYAVAASRPQFFFPMGLHRLHGSSGVARAVEGVARVCGLTRLLGSPVITTAVPADPAGIRPGGAPPR